MICLLRESCQRALDGRLTKARSEEIQQACGLRYNPHGLLANDLLRRRLSLVGAVTFDWVHSLLQDGVFVLEASLVVKACSDYV